MKGSKVLSGLGLFLLAFSGAVASASTFRSTTVWFAGVAGPEQTTVPFACVTDGTGCLGTHGPSMGKQLYADQALSQSLRG